MRIRTILLTILTAPAFWGLIFSGGELRAESSAPPAETKKQEPVIKDDFLIWELELAENSYKINKSIENKTRLLSAYEKVTVARCMPELLTTLAYTPDPQDTICLDFIGKALTIDPANPIALCAREGIDHVVCKAAFKKQKTGRYDTQLEIRQGTASLDDLLKSKKDEDLQRKKLSETEARFYAARSDHSSKATPESLKKLHEAVNQLLTLTCRDSRIRLTEPSPEELRAREQAAAVAAPGQNPESSMFVNLATPTPADPFAEVFRSRRPEDDIKLPESDRTWEISRKCDETLKRVKDMRPPPAYVPCAAQGFYSPECISALRLEKKSAPAQQKGRQESKSGSGIESF